MVRWAGLEVMDTWTVNDQIWRLMRDRVVTGGGIEPEMRKAGKHESINITL